MKISVEKSVSQAGGKAIKIPLSNLVLPPDHPEGYNKIQDNYKSELFVMKSKHQDLNVYIIKPLSSKGPLCMVNWRQLFDLHKSQGSDMPSNWAPDANLPTLLIKKPIRDITTPQHDHPCGTRSKTKANSVILQSSSEDETKEDQTVLESSFEDRGSFGVIGNLFNCISTKFWQ